MPVFPSQNLRLDNSHSRPWLIVRKKRDYKLWTGKMIPWQVKSPPRRVTSSGDNSLHRPISPREEIQGSFMIGKFRRVCNRTPFYTVGDGLSPERKLARITN